MSNDIGIQIRDMLQANSDGRMNYGIPIIDDATRGIFPGQLIVIGAATGVGKTELLTLISKSAARPGKRVALYALEAHELEIHQRLFYQELSSIYFNSEPENRPKIPFNHFNYGDFHAGRYNKPLSCFWDEATNRLKKIIENIDFVYPRNVTANTLALDIESKFEDGYALFLVDHLHYFDHEANELEAVKSHMKLFEGVTHNRKASIIFASHLRKADRFRPDFPDKHELHGSSEISKRAHVVIMLGPPTKNSFGNMFDHDKTKLPTIFHIDKWRIDGSITRCYGIHTFETTSRKYSDTYIVLEPTWEKGQMVFNIVNKRSDKPFWATRGRTREDTIV